LIERGHRRTYRSQAVLLAQGESPDGVIALVDGLVKVKVVQGNEAGDRLTLMLRGPGEVLGEMGVRRHGRFTTVPARGPLTPAPEEALTMAPPSPWWSGWRIWHGRKGSRR
jgi:CRP/FNR family cyclic AMP-dependent transcriptional regulator